MLQSTDTPTFIFVIASYAQVLLKDVAGLDSENIASQSREIWRTEVRRFCNGCASCDIHLSSKF